MSLRDDAELVAEAAALVKYACGPFGSMYTAEDIAGRILDAIDRRPPTAPPEPLGAVEHCPGCDCPISPDCTMSCATMTDCGHRAATPGTAPTLTMKLTCTGGGTGRITSSAVVERKLRP